MHNAVILQKLCQKSNISYILFSHDFKIMEFDDAIISLANNERNLQINNDIRESFWEFIGIENDILNLLNKKQENLKIPMIYKNSIYYDIEIEFFEKTEDKNIFFVYIVKKSGYATDYLKIIQEINKKTLVSQNSEIKINKEKNYYDLLNKQLITFHVNSEGIITKVNDVCCYFFALKEIDMLGHHFSNFFLTRESKIKDTTNKIFNATNSIGEEIFFSASVIPITYNNTFFENIIICHDVSYLKRIEKELEYAAFHDSLTGLANRTQLLKKIDEAILESNNKNNNFTLCFLDIKNFKSINENYGYHAGDMTLKHIASLLKKFVQPFDTVSRVGGDQFCILFNNIENENFIPPMIKELIKLSFDNPLLYSENDIIKFEFNFSSSSYPKDATDSKSLFDFLKKDMYK